MEKSTVLASSKAYKLRKKISLREVRKVESTERAERKKQHDVIIAAEKSRLYEICKHGANLIANHNIKAAKSVKIGEAVIQYHQHVAKEQQQKADRIKRERMQALKDDDEAAYMKLIDEEKDIRLTHLLKQTGQFLDSLSFSVMEQKNANKNIKLTIEVKKTQ